MTPTLNAIQREHWRVRAEDGRIPKEIHMIHPVYETCLKEWDRSGGSILDRSNLPETILGMPINRKPVGSMDAPGWQIIVESEEPSPP